MRFRDALTLHTCPLLLRVALAVVFMWAGIPKFGPETFKGEQAATLVQLGIGQKTVLAGTPPTEGEAASPGQADAAAPEDQEPTAPASAPSEGEPAESDQPGPESPSGEAVPAEDGSNQDSAPETSTEQAAQPEQPAATERADGAGVQYEVHARKVEGLTIMLHNAGHPYPRIFAWIAMLTEAIGGAMLLIGLFSRVWGLGLAIAMVYAFVLTALPAIQGQVDPAATNRALAFVAAFGKTAHLVQLSVFLQFILFVASWCIFLGGPGALSLDRLIFRRGPDD